MKTPGLNVFVTRMLYKLQHVVFNVWMPLKTPADGSQAKTKFLIFGGFSFDSGGNACRNIGTI